MREEIDATKDEELKNQLLDEEASLRRVAEKMYQAEQAKGSKVEDIADVIEMAIADNLIRIPEEDFANYSDRNNVNEAIRKNYFTKKNQKVTPKDRLDVVAQSISDLVGFEVTEADIVDFIKKYPEGIGERGTKKQNTFFGSNNPKELARQLMHEAELAFGVELDEVGMEAFDIAVKNNREAIEELYSKPLSETEIETLSNEYDEYLNTLTDEQRKREEAKYRFDEREQVVEGTEDANLKAIKDRDAEAREAEEGIVPIVEQVVETIEERIAKAKAALKERNAGKLRSGLDFENLDLYTELAYLYIRKGVKSAADFAKEIGEELSDAIKKAWDAANANYKAEAENFDKWKDYAKKQFEAEDGGLEFQDFKARFNKKFNVAADDVALVEIFSEAQSEYNSERGKSVSKKEVDKSFKPEKKKVEVDEKTALKDQIRLEVKAAREGFKAAKAEQKDFADRIKDFLKNNKIASSLNEMQTKALVNKAASVRTEAQLDKFIEYAERVIEDAQFVVKMKEVSDLQKMANRRNHVSFNTTVKEFTSVKPEDIPDNKLGGYIDVLKDLTARVPNYKKMQDMYYDIMQFKRLPNPFENLKTYKQADEALRKALSVNINTIEDFKELIKNIRAFNKKVNQLFANEDITEQDKDDLLDYLAKDMDAFEAKFGDKVDALKDNLIRDALAVQRTQEFKDAVLGLKGSSDKEVMFEFSSIKPEKLKKLPLQMLADLSDILQNVSDGFIDRQRLRDIIAESRAINNGEQLKNQIETKSPSVENVNEKVSELRTSEAAFREGDLGLGKRKAGALTKYVYNPLMTAIEKSNSETQKGVAKLQEIFKGHNKKSRFRMGIAANMLQEYMAQFDPTFEGVENIGNRDWVKETFDSGKQANFKDVNEANEVAAAWASLSGGKATKPLIGRKVATISGNAISPKDIYDSFMADDGKFLTKEERKSLAEWFKYADEVNADKQKAANEMRGLEFKPIPFYNPRIRRKGDVHVDEDVQTISVDKSNRISISSPFGKSRNTQDVGALSYDIVETAERAIAGANKDYELTKALQEVNRTLGAATNDKTKNVISVIVYDVS